MTIFERLGGESAIQAAVVLFYEKVMGDPELARFFHGMDLERQIGKQIAFMTMAFAGPNHYTGRDLRSAHARLVREGLNHHHFDEVAKHLQSTLSELEVAPDVITDIMAIVGSTRADVLGG